MPLRDPFKSLTDRLSSIGRELARKTHEQSINTPKTSGSVSSKAVTGERRGKKGRRTEQVVPITKECGATGPWVVSARKKMNYARNRKCWSRWELRVGIVLTSSSLPRRFLSYHFLLRSLTHLLTHSLARSFVFSFVRCFPLSPQRTTRKTES